MPLIRPVGLAVPLFALAALCAPGFAVAAAAQAQDTSRAVPVVADTVVPAARDTAARSGTTQPRQRRDRNRLSREEIMEGNQRNLMEVIRAKRPHWLRRNNSDRSLDPSERVALFVNGLDQTRGQTLENFAPHMVVRAEYVAPADATVLYGVRYPKGIILLFTS